MKAKMSIQKETNADLSGKFTEMLVIIIMITVFGSLLISLIGSASEGIADIASDKYDAQVALGDNASSALKALYGILANDAIIEVVLVAVFLLVIVFTLLNVMNKSKR